MNFEAWLRHQGLSASSVKKYESAVRGAMSQWAIDHGFIEGPLTSLVNRASFETIAAKIRALPIFQQRNQRGNNMYNAALIKFGEYLSKGYHGDIESDIDAIMDSAETSPTEKCNLVKSRIGQGIFRQKLMAYWGACSVTGFKDTQLLVASHIKPWSVSNNAERLDPFNGLLLIPNLDKTFDAGFITFNPAGVILISPLLTTPEKLGISQQLSVSLAQPHQVYMDFHRTTVFRAA
ncbi:MAG: HNH endonuclease signature motif containing protein [Giesbergeria sp.]|uniref:HNH endonuclease n=1 Tax=Giesbergeria sp. TaxID=2818473 RepID=UPI002609BC73|nr:HNH endonuclease signature motif containing protein [Giesbergeria sp.]MDD2608679.1 HNH endonuclease signature motif containing protein [Giesbergeria sp.]